RRTRRRPRAPRRSAWRPSASPRSRRRRSAAWPRSRRWRSRTRTVPATRRARRSRSPRKRRRRSPRSRQPRPRGRRSRKGRKGVRRMGNVRVFQLARDLNLQSQEVIDRLKKLGVDVKTASSSIDEDTADKLKRALKIDQLTARKRRIYGSEEDEAER